MEGGSCSLFAGRKTFRERAEVVRREKRASSLVSFPCPSDHDLASFSSPSLSPTHTSSTLFPHLGHLDTLSPHVDVE